jgi:hypothetical protein
MGRSSQSTIMDVSRSRVFLEVEAAHHNCHVDARLFIAWAQLDVRFFSERSLELDAPARPPVLFFRRKFLDMTINLPVGFSGQFCAVERAIVRKVQRADGSCLVSEGPDFL